MRAAAIDVGTNSTRLLIVESSAVDKYKVLSRKIITTRLGEGIEKNKIINKDAIKRLITALTEYKKIIDKYKVEKVMLVGTSALRDVKNSNYLVDLILDKFGYKLCIITGMKEAKLIYNGVKMDLPFSRFMIIDIGGGSTEFIWSHNNKIDFKSINIGAVRVTENYIENPHNYLPQKISKKIHNKVINILEKEFSYNLDELKAIGVGGTITTVAAISQKIENYDPDKIHNYELNITEISKIYNRLRKQEIKKRKQVKGLQPERADIILAGLIILKSILSYFKVKRLIVSEKDILYGMINEIKMTNGFGEEP